MKEMNYLRMGSEEFEVADGKIRESFVTPEMFGAIGDGVADDTEALKSALESGKNVHLPSNRTYIITGAVPIYSNTVVTIDGTVKAGGIGVVGFELFDRVTETPAYSGVHDVIINGSGVIDCNKDLVGATSTPLRIYHCKNIVVKDITILDFPVYHAIEIGGSDGVVLDNVKIKGSVYNAEKTWSFEAINIEYITQTGASGGIPYDYTPVKNLTIKNCKFEPSDNNVWCGGIGCHHKDYTGEHLFENITIENCTFRGERLNPKFDEKTYYNSCIFLEAVFENVIIRNNTFEDIEGTGVYIGEGCKNVDVVGNVFDGIGYECIAYNKSCEKLNFLSNIFINFSLKDVEDEQVTFRYPAIYGAYAVNGISVCNNVFKCTSKYAAVPIHFPAAAWSGMTIKRVEGNTLVGLEGCVDANNKATVYGNFIRYNVPTDLKTFGTAEVKWGSINFATDIRKFRHLVIEYHVGDEYSSKVVDVMSLSNNKQIILEGVNFTSNAFLLYRATLVFTDFVKVGFQKNQRSSMTGSIINYSVQSADQDFIGIVSIKGIEGNNVMV